MLVRTPLEHVAMLLEVRDDFNRGLGRSQVEIGIVVGTEIGWTLSRRQEVVDVRHEDVDGCVESLSDGVI